MSLIAQVQAKVAQKGLQVVLAILKEKLLAVVNQRAQAQMLKRRTGLILESLCRVTMK